MASRKRPNNIETKLVTERKRRHSDLVIMWQSVIGITSIIFQELWTTLLRMWEFLQLWFSSSERFELQTWLEKYLPYVPEDFSDSWRDGRLLAILLNKLQPGCYPDAYELDPDYGLKNVYKAFDVLEMYFGIKPNTSVEEIVTCIDGTDSKLFGILLELKHFTDCQPESKVPPKPEPKECPEQTIISPSCIVKGTGLVVAFLGRIANFIIFCNFISDLDVVIEIRGPNTLCSERITKRSPKKKHSSASWEFPKLLTRSSSINEEINSLTGEEMKLAKKIITLEYEIIGNQISVGYRPKEKGQHKVSILWHGQHVSDSPYFVNVEDPLDMAATNQLKYRKSALKMANEGDKNESRKISVRFQEGGVKYRELTKPLGRIRSRRILRYIVKINGKDIPINAESIDSLATELLKMEYDIETCPSSHRRNSWGFAGDAERKKSVIRQFGIDVSELEAQISLKRTRSLSINSGSKKILEKSNSFDNLTPKLNIVKEDVCESDNNIYENEAYYAYINEDDVLEKNEKNSNETFETEINSRTGDETETHKSFNELLPNKSIESSNARAGDKIKFDRISLLSMERPQDHIVDNLNEDHQPNILLYESPDVSGIEPTVKMSFNCEDSNEELNNNERYDENADFTISKNSKVFSPLSKKVRKKNSKSKKYQRCKKCIKAKKGKKSTKQIFLRESPLSTSSIIASPIMVPRNWRKIKRPMLERKNYTSQNLLKCLKNMDIVQLANRKDENDIDQNLIDSQRSFDEDLDISNNFSASNNSHHQGNSRPNEERCPKINGETKISCVNQTVRNIIHDEISKNNDKLSKAEVKEPTIRKVIINNNFSAIRPSIIADDAVNNTEESKTLRTHKLRTIELLNFKQFSPPLDAQSSISPVKSQIVQWESNLLTGNQKSPSKKTYSSEIEQVSVKDKLAFWENAYKTESNSVTQSMLDNNRKINFVVSKKSCKSAESDTNTMRNDLHNIPCTVEKTRISGAAVKEKTEARISMNTETNVAAKKDIDHKITPEFRSNARIIRRLSFSDPGVFETNTEHIWNSTYLNSLESSTKGCLSSSNDDNLEQYFSDNSDGFSAGTGKHSLDDEYIDDEISESASEYWGDLSIVKDLKVARCSIDSSVSAEDYLKNHHQHLKSFPDECKVFGIAVYYGYVAVKNRFQVYTGDAGFGNLSVSIQGFGRHDVPLVSVVYVRKDVYEVTYQVMTKGYFLISVRWMEKEIPGSPFVCKVTF